MTQDHGLSWEEFNNRFASQGGVQASQINIIDDEGDSAVIVVTSSSPSALWQSFDGGQSWAPLPHELTQVPGQSFLVVSHLPHATWYLLNGSKFHRSTDYGRTWDSSDAGIVQPTGLFEDPSQGSILYVTSPYEYSGSESHGGLLRSTDGGNTWTQVLNLYNAFSITSAMISGMLSLIDGTLLLSITSTNSSDFDNSGLLRSIDGGLNWAIVQIGLPNWVRPLKIIEHSQLPGTIFLVSIYYGLYRSLDGGVSWNHCFANSPSLTQSASDIFQNRGNGNIYVSLLGQGIYHSLDGGDHWQPFSAPPFGSRGRIAVLERGIYYSDISFRLWQLEREQMQWRAFEVPIIPDTAVALDPPFHESSDSLFFLATLYPSPTLDSQPVQKIFVINTQSHTWTWGGAFPFLTSQVVRTVAIGDSIVFYITALSGLKVSTDHGRTWLFRSSPNGGLIRSVTDIDSVMWTLCGDPSNTSVYRTTNCGTNWLPLDYDGPQLDAWSLIYATPHTLLTKCQNQCVRYVNSEWETLGQVWNGYNVDQLVDPSLDQAIILGRVFYGPEIALSSDSGRTWAHVNYGYPISSQNSGFDDFQSVPAQHRLWATSALGPCYLDFSDLDVQTMPSPSLSEKLWISAFPNPSNSNWTIKFSIPREGEVDVLLYDSLGREVMHLFHGFARKGRHQLMFAADRLSSGTYFLRLLEAGQIVTTSLKLVR